MTHCLSLAVQTGEQTSEMVWSNPVLDTTYFEIKIFRVPQNRPQEWDDE